MADNAGNPFMRGLTAAERGEFSAADEIARAMLAKNPHDVHAFQIQGYSLFLQGRLHESLDAFLAANRAAPRQPAILKWLGKVYQEIGDFEKAKAAFAAAVRTAPSDAEALSLLGTMHAYLHEQDDALRAFDAAIKADPKSVQALCKLARYLEQIHRHDNARRIAEKATALDPGAVTPAAIIADLDLSAGAYDKVLETLKPFHESDAISKPQRSQIAYQSAQALHNLKRYDEAFARYEEANALLCEMSRDLVEREVSPLTPKSIRGQIDFFRRDQTPWTQQDGFMSPAPVFILGFFRSGTTWLENILAAHPKATVLDEEDNFADAWTDLYITDAGRRRLATLTRDEIEHYRGAYWSRVRAKLREKSDAPIVVDKNPANTVMLGLIHRLFPEAKIIFAIRDPRDVVWSCFQQRFGINAAMYQFLRLETAADYYDKAMELGTLFRERFSLDLLESRYEDVVADFEGSTRRLLSFLDLEWTDSLESYHENAKNRLNFTPSAKQVVQKPYTTSIGKWRNYAAHMESVMPTLDKWASHYGYDTD